MTSARLRSNDATLARLSVAGLIAAVPSRTGKGKPSFALTEAGRSLAADLSPEPPTLDELLRAVVELREEVCALRQEVLTLREEVLPCGEIGLRAHGEDTESDSAGRDAFVSLLHHAMRQVDVRDRCGGLIPIPALRKAMAYLPMSHEDFNLGLLDAERAYRIDLKVANDPRACAAPQDGISVAGRGLLYYAAVR